LTKKHLKLLEDYRNETITDFSSLDTSNLKLDNLSVAKDTFTKFSHSVFEISQKCSDNFISTCSTVIDSSVDTLSTSGLNIPCSFAVIGLGSVARGTATPYSDLEYVFVIESDSHIDYFTKLAVDSYFKIGNMRESPLKGFNIPELGKSYRDSATVGLRIDGISKNAGNIPTGKGDGSKSLILTVKQLTELYSETLTSPASDIADIADLLSSIVLICAYENGQVLFDKALENLQTILAENIDNTVLINKRIQLLKADVEAYNFLPTFKSFGLPDNTKLKVKSDIFRYPTLLVDHLRLLIASNKMTPWSILCHLKKQNIVTDKQLFSLQLITALAIYIRTTAYLKLGTQEDHLSLYPPTECFIKGIYHLSRDMFVLLAFVIVPVKRSIKRHLDNIDSQSKWNGHSMLKMLVNQVGSDSPGFTLKMEIEYFCGDFEQSLKTLTANCGTNVFDNIPEEFCKTTRNSSYSETILHSQHCDHEESDVSAAYSKYIEMAAYLLYASRKYDSCLKYFTWLAENFVNSASDRLKWKVLAADSANQLHNYHEAFSLIGEIFSTLKSLYKLKSSNTLYRFVREQSKQPERLIQDKQIFEIVAQAFRVTSKAYQNVKHYVQSEELANAALKLFDTLYSQKPESQLDSHYVDLVVSLALVQSDKGEHDKGVEYLNYSLSKLKRVHTDQTNHPDIALLLSGLGQLHEKAKNYDYSLNFYHRALAMTKQSYCSDHVDVAQGYRKVATLQAKMADYSSSLSNYQIAERLFDVLKVNEHEKACLLVDIGLLHCCKRDYDSALSYLDSALSLIKSRVQTTHIDIADINSAYGRIYSEMGQTELALKHYTKSLEITTGVFSSIHDIPFFSKIHGEMGNLSVKLSAEATLLNIERACREVNSVCPEVASCYLRVGNIYDDMCIYDQALLFHFKACEMFRAVYGSHAVCADVAGCYSNIGIVYKNMGEFSKALDYHRKSLNMQLAVYGNDAAHADIANSNTLIGVVYFQLGKYKRALKYYRKGLEMRQAVFGSDAVHSDIANSHHNIGNVFFHMNEFGKALEYYKKGLKMNLAIYGSDAVHRHIANDYVGIGNVYLKMDEYVKALLYYSQGLEMKLNVYGSDSVHEDVAYCYANIGVVYRHMGASSMALKHCRKALEMRLAVHGSNVVHADIASSYLNISVLYSDLDKNSKALELSMKALKMQLAVYGTDVVHADIACSYSCIGTVYKNMGEYSKALEYYTKSLEMQQAVYGSDAANATIANSYHSIGTMYYCMCEYSKALEWFKNCLDIRQALYRSDGVYADIAWSCHRIALVCYKLSDYTRSLQYYIKSINMYYPYKHSQKS